MWLGDTLETDRMRRRRFSASYSRGIGMSAFIVDDDCIERAVRVFDHFKNSAFMAQEDCDALGSRMKRLNDEAVSCRYSDAQRESYHSPATEEDEFAFSYKHRTPMSSLGDKVQALKSLQCLIYQCSEGDIPEKSTLYADMVKKERLLMGEIIGMLPEYDRAVWG